MTKLSMGAISVAMLAVIASVSFPVYMKHERKVALEREASWLANAAAQIALPPASGCPHGAFRVTDHSVAGWPVSLPVWTREGPILCDDHGYTVNGRALTEEQAKAYADSALEEHRFDKSRRS